MGGCAAEILETTEHALDGVSVAINHGRKATFPYALGFGRNLRHRADSLDLAAQAVAGAASAFSSDRVIATASDPLMNPSSSRALDGLRHADSFTGSAGVSAPTVTGAVTLDKIFVAAHLAATTPVPTSGLDPQASSAGHTLFSVDEGTTFSIRGAMPTVHGGHSH